MLAHGLEDVIAHGLGDLIARGFEDVIAHGLEDEVAHGSEEVVALGLEEKTDIYEYCISRTFCTKHISELYAAVLFRRQSLLRKPTTV